jgi:hypothetical protein
MSEKLIEKFELYDLLGIIIPGLVSMGFVYAFSYWTGYNITIPTMPEALQVFVLAAVAIVLGQAIQALSSILEPFYFWTWFGMPSNRALQGKTKRMSKAFAGEIKERFKTHILKGENRDVSDHEIFMSALSICTHKSLGRVARFNSLYAYHRALTTLLLVATITTAIIIASCDPNPPAAWRIFLIELGVTFLFWYRTKQRGMYFADEVLRMADLEIEQPVSPTGKLT